ncbi:MAG: hypothetical protein WDZ37_06070 [Solirubrobacterales bacterium]
MRLHITLADQVVHDLDRRVGPRGRSGFIARAVQQALDDERRWEKIEQAIGSVPDHGHEWDDDPAAWVRAQRRGAERRVG